MDDSRIGYEITALAAGIDAFERTLAPERRALGDEGLIPLYLGAELVRARIYEDWERVDADIGEMASVVADTPGGPRRMFLEKLLESLRMASLLFRGGSAGYGEKLVRLVGVPAEALDDDFIPELQEKLEVMLAAAGFGSGSFADRVSAWESGEAIPPGRLAAVFRELMLEARDRTNRYVVPTGDYLMELNPVRDTHYTARCDFARGMMDINVGNTFSRSALKHLVAHEIFPGHATQNIHTMESFRKGRATADVLLCSLNGITGVLQEGIGDQGVELVHWIEDRDDEIQAVLRRYRSAAATRAAWMLNVEGRTDHEVLDYLRTVAAMQEARAAGRVRMARHPFRGPFIASYFYGNEAVRTVRTGIGEDPVRRRAFVAELYGRMHSPESLCLAMDVAYTARGGI